MKNQSEEILDLVNEADEIIGEVSRSKANSHQNLLHREVGVILIDIQKRTLIQKRAKNKSLPGFWILSAAGHVKKGVDPMITAHEEISEELGFDTKLIFVDKELMHYPNETNFGYIFIGLIPKNAKIKIDPQETDEIRWITSSDYLEMKSKGEIIYETSLHFLNKLWAGKYDASVSDLLK